MSPFVFDPAAHQPPNQTHTAHQVFIVRAVMGLEGEGESVVFQHAFLSRTTAQALRATGQKQFPMFIWECEMVPMNDIAFAEHCVSKLTEVAAEVNRRDELWLAAAADYLQRA